MTTQASFTYWKPIASETTKKNCVDDDYDRDDVETEEWRKKTRKFQRNVHRKQKVLKTKKGHREQSTWNNELSYFDTASHFFLAIVRSPFFFFFFYFFSFSLRACRLFFSCHRYRSIWLPCAHRGISFFILLVGVSFPIQIVICEMSMS